MIGNIKETFPPPPKTGVQLKQVLQDPGYVIDVEGSCCMLYAILARLYEYNINCPMLKVWKEIKNKQKY